VDFRCYLPAFLALGLVRGLLSLEIHSERSTSVIRILGYIQRLKENGY
jgi:hypothetical protein